MFTLLSFKAFARNVLFLFSLLFPVLRERERERMNVRTKKKFSSSLHSCVHLSLQPRHFLSHTMDLQRPSLIRRKNKKKREKRGGKISLLFPLPSLFSLSERRFSLSLSLEDALTPRRSIRDRGRWRCGRGVRVLVVCARARAKKHRLLREEEEEDFERREFKRFFLSRDDDERRRQKTKNKEIKRDFKPHRKRREPLLFFFCYSY